MIKQDPPIIPVILFETFPETDKNKKIEQMNMITAARTNSNGCFEVKLTITKTIPRALKRNGTEYFFRSNETFCIINGVFGQLQIYNI